VQIIVVHPRLKQALSISLRLRWVIAAAAVLVLFMATGSGVMSYVTIKHALQAKLPFLENLFELPNIASRGLIGRDIVARDDYVRQNIDALAVKLGHLQAQMTRIDAIGERVAAMAGIKPSDLPKAPGRGGPLAAGARSLSLDELGQEVERVSATLEQRADYLNLIEQELIFRTVTTKLLPTNQPLADGFTGSRFGGRIDPFTGRSAMHEGIDFNAPVGTPILAAGAGVVVFAEYHHSYGNQIDLDHGNGLVTRYAHASKLLVKAGDIVKQGQRIAEVGSTGRSTGPHLHFEVRVDDEAQDPFNYLQAGLDLKAGRIRPALAKSAAGADGARR
jgi:murein DD-endopeptidase MepM/ murein hydrolase activator NlpD